MELFLSIIIPVYNAGTTIRRLLDSIYQLELSENEFEVIAVDDGSSDNSLLYLREYARKHKNLLVLHDSLTQLGPAQRRNEGLQKARGTYVWFVDSDDQIKAANVVQLREIFEAEGLDIVVFNMEVIEDGRFLTWDWLEESPSLSGKDLYCQNHIFSAPWNKICKREFLISHSLFFEPNVYPEDQKWSDECFSVATKAKIYGTVLYCYHRESAVSLSRGTKAIRQFMQGFPKVIESHLEQALHRGAPRFWVHALYHLFRGWIYRVNIAKQTQLLQATHEQYSQIQRLSRKALRRLPVVLDSKYFYLVSLAVSAHWFTCSKTFLNIILNKLRAQLSKAHACKN